MGEGVDTYSFTVKFIGKTGNKGTAQGKITTQPGEAVDVAVEKAEAAVRATFDPVPIDIVRTTVRKLKPKKTKKK